VAAVARRGVVAYQVAAVAAVAQVAAVAAVARVACQVAASPVTYRLS